ncbi:MAG: FAD-dependent monooxygenase [Deltaproteobacteria bacterium]|nr:FAD-dependent monooxygenase [Deltaproteobacteria bacterium]
MRGAILSTNPVVIAGGGPTGMMLAAELKLAGVDALVIERRTTQELPSARSGGLHARTIEVLDQRGVAERFLAEGKPMQVAGFAMIRLDISDFPTRHNYGLALWQSHFERILAGWVSELGVQTLRGVEVTGFTQDAEGVDVTLSDGRTLRAQFLVGCDGGRSLVRKQAGIDFPGWDASVSYLIAEGTMTAPALGIRHGLKGVNAIGQREGDRVGLVLIEPEVRKGDAPTMDELRAALLDVYGSDFGLREVTFLSRFTDAARQAAAYRKGRVLLAGDSAHIHAPTGGQGLNTGVQDAVNLGWKLAQVVKGISPESLLDTYQAERQPVGARVLELTMAQTALLRGDDRTAALRKTMADLFKLDEPRKRYAGMMSALDLHYDFGSTIAPSGTEGSAAQAAHPLVGRRMPDLEITTEAGPRRVFTFLHRARPLLLDLGAPRSLELGPWSDRVQRVDARYTGPWELPVLGVVSAPSAVLVRPDGHVAWVGEGSDRGLQDALRAWF